MVSIKTYNDIEVMTMVTDGLEWYEANSSKATILELLDFQDKLSILSVNLAQITADCKASYLCAYFNRKHTFSIKKLYHIGNGDSGTMAQEKAQLEITKENDVERGAERASYTISLQLKQINKVLSACQQRLSFAKSEKIRMESLTHDNKRI